MFPALAKAVDTLQGRLAIRKEIYLVTDGQASDVPGTSTSYTLVIACPTITPRDPASATAPGTKINTIEIEEQ